MERRTIQITTNQSSIRSLQFFFVRRGEVLKGFTNLFPGNVQEDDEEGEGGSGTIAEHYGWFYTLYHLANEGGILNLTGDKRVSDVNFITMLNYLSVQEEINKEEVKQQRRIQQQNSWK